MVADGEQAAEFPAAFGIDPDSDKYKSFDGATPEGLYVITYKKYKSEFHRFLGISYPNLADAARGLAQGVISLKEYKKIYQDIRKSGHTPCGTGLGCGIGIHGGGVFRYFGKNKETDWTEGCIALDNPAMEKLFNLCRPGDPVIIFNSRRNLCGIIRPFTHIKDMDENGVPICPDGICTYQVEVPVSWGRMIIIIKEGKDYGRSMKVMGYKDDVQKPFFILVDRNADGYLSTVDSISGSIADEKRPDATYERIREAVVSALSRGDILDSVDGR
ncbi:MAG: L,D-transpeptidase [Deltaproteobacteria bacterium]|nr:L,D-transpeptidase [Deltaproteobacteria bacterium]